MFCFFPRLIFFKRTSFSFLHFRCFSFYFFSAAAAFLASFSCSALASLRERKGGGGERVDRFRRFSFRRARAFHASCAPPRAGGLDRRARNLVRRRARGISPTWWQKDGRRRGRGAREGGRAAAKTHAAAVPAVAPRALAAHALHTRTRRRLHISYRSLRCAAVRPSLSLAGLPCLAARAAARARSTSRWLPRDMTEGRDNEKKGTRRDRAAW